MNNFHSIKIKLIIPLLFILILVFFASSLVIIDRESRSANDSLINSAKSFSSLSVTNIIKNYELYYDSGFYKYAEIIDDLMSLNRNVERIQIVNVSGYILFDSTELEEGKYSEGIQRKLDPMLIERAGSSTASTEIVEDEKIVDIIQPYKEEWGRHDYSIRYIFSLASLDRMTQEMISTVFIYSGTFILLSFFLIFFLLNRFITAPIGELIKSVRLIGKGKLGHAVKINSRDEIGELASTFNKMTIDLKKSRDSIRDYSKNLEKQVAERTGELKEKNKYLKKINKDLTIARKELDTLNKNLEKRVKNRTAEVEQLLKQKDEFINQLGHDLKTPLMPLITLIPLLEKKEIDSTRREWFEVLHRNTDYMKNLVVKTIELAKLNSPKTKFSLEEINLNDEVNKILINKKTLFENKEIKINNKISEKFLVKADKLRLEELLTNLLENSVKYTKGKGRITIEAEKENDFAKISINDTGIGMDKEEVKHIFDEFYKADKSRHDFYSSGLGLSICKRIVERHNGKIWVESPGLGKGTTVFFTLPLVSS